MSEEHHRRRRERLERKLASENERWADVQSSSQPLENLSGPELEAQLRKQVEARIQRRNAFYMHLLVYVGINLFLWLIWLSEPSKELWPLYVSLPWGVGLAAHAMVFYQNSSWGLQRREQTIRREIELEKRRLGLADETYEKPKRDQVMRLSDDGEMIPADDDDAQPTAKAKRGQL